MYKVLYNGRQDDDGKEIEESDEAKNAVRVSGVLELIGLAGDDAVELLKLIIVKSTDLDRESVEALDSLDGIDLLETIYKVNKSFFVKCMTKLKEKVGKKDTKKAKSK